MSIHGLPDISPPGEGVRGAQGKSGAAESVVEVINPAGAADVVLVCEHASNFIPPEFNDLDLRADALHSHIAWDPGALKVAKAMSAVLDAPLVAQCVSRLLYDCNRAPEAPGAVPASSEIYRIPGNEKLSEAGRRARAERFYKPFREALSACIDGRMQNPRAPVVVTVHSFNPVYHGVKRDVDIGVLHDRDMRLADAILNLSAGHDGGLAFRRNQPYGPADGVTHTLREHALPHGLLNVMIEIRNDLIAHTASQRSMAERLAGLVAQALEAQAGLGQDTEVLAGGNNRQASRTGEA